MSGEMMLFPSTVEEFMEQYKVVDRDHILSNGAEFVPLFRMRQWFDHLQAHPITNADRIRAMTDEELAKFLTTEDMCELICSPAPPHCDGQCKQKMLDWLKQEASDET